VLSQPIQEWTEVDLQRLVDGRAQENEVLEFKSSMWGKGDEEVREMLRDISSMANQKGGRILIGIEADADGAAVAMTGVESGNHVERITSSCLDNIDPRLIGLRVQDIPLESGGVVVAIVVPPSLNSPHMVTFRGLNQFWIRHNRQKAPMNVDEIRGAVQRTIDSVSVAERYIQGCIERVLQVADDIRKPWLLLAATPVPLTYDLIDIQDLALRQVLTEMRQHPVCRSILFTFRTGGCIPTLRGLRAAVGTRSGSTVDFLELHRNGHLEVATSFPWRESDAHSIPAKLIACFIDDFVNLTGQVWRHIGIARPLLLRVVFLNAYRMWLGLPSEVHPPSDMRDRLWEEQHLMIPEQYATDITSAEERKRLVKTLNDLLWNAFGLEECSVISREGGWI